MKKFMICVVATWLFFLSPAGTLCSAVGGVIPSPEELESYYPPKAEGPVYLFRMLALEGAFSGIAAELSAEDMAGARDMFKVFKTEYVSIKNMVAEWRNDFPEDEINALGIALEGTDRDLMFSSLGEVGKICHRCHVASMVATQQKYRWGNFSELAVTDTVGGTKMAYAAFKKFIAADMAGVRVDAGQGQWDSARNHFNTLKERFVVLTDTCFACHAEKPPTFTKPVSLPLLESELGKERPDSARVNDLLQALGGQSCAGCHLVHVPAAMASASAGRQENR